MSKWSRDEFMLVMNLYSKLRYGQFNYRNIEVIKLAELIGKTPGAVAFKLVHLSRQDPKHKDRVKGLANPGKNAIEMYNEFSSNWNEMLYQSEVLLAKYQNKKVEEIALDQNEIQEIEKDILSGKEGKYIERVVKTRVNQSLFRKVVINNYSNSCAICSLDIQNLLVASHILKWSENEEHRLNPTNGLCLCNIHDRAFELGYIGINSEYSILISDGLKLAKDKQTFSSLFGRHENKSLILPDKFYPNIDFLQSHLKHNFKG
ncbi:HNH endonuclease [Niabella ginsengisoli]|uniref:HNH endonuclease n=1 Tax=Niabella ginsengisoli TaxID=522298 RepID=A0ABS9SJW1_9BACT|nr:HNH endonuclease [Niabella ginsengisoli]MCH5598651.1 HNH endonuclease [Niabella ginsengisoli]